MSTGLKFKPRILGMICNWCCYGGADLCGVSRFQYPPYIRLIRVMCSARVDPAHIFLAFSTGQDAVFVGGCHLNDCHYITNGNYDTITMITICKKLLKHIGMNPDRLRLEWVSAGEGIRFANIMNEYGAQLEKLGPLGSSEGLDEKTLKSRLEALISLVPYIRLAASERLRLPVRSEEACHKYLSSDEFDRLVNETIIEKLAMGRIVALLREGPLPTAGIAKGLGMTASEVSKHLISSSKHGLVRYDAGRKCYALDQVV